MPKRPAISDQATVALAHDPSSLVQSIIGDQPFVKLLADFSRGGAAARRSHVDARHMEAGSQCLLDVVTVLQIANPVIDSKPIGELPKPKFLRVHRAGRLHDIAHAIARHRSSASAPAVRPLDFSGNHASGPLRIRQHPGDLGSEANAPMPIASRPQYSATTGSRAASIIVTFPSMNWG